MHRCCLVHNSRIVLHCRISETGKGKAVKCMKGSSHSHLVHTLSLGTVIHSPNEPLDVGDERGISLCKHLHKVKVFIPGCLGLLLFKVGPFSRNCRFKDVSGDEFGGRHCQMRAQLLPLEIYSKSRSKKGNHRINFISEEGRGCVIKEDVPGGPVHGINHCLKVGPSIPSKVCQKGAVVHVNAEDRGPVDAIV